MKSNQSPKKDIKPNNPSKLADSFQPRKFPKKQYQNLTHHLLISIVGILILIVIICTVGGAIGTHLTAKRIHHKPETVRTTQTVKKKPRKVSSTKYKTKSTKNLSPKQSEKLLGHWLIKLNYPTVKSETALKNYQRSNQVTEKKISQKLVNLTQDSSSKSSQNHNIKNFINKQLLRNN